MIRQLDDIYWPIEYWFKNIDKFDLNDTSFMFIEGGYYYNKLMSNKLILDGKFELALNYSPDAYINLFCNYCFNDTDKADFYFGKIVNYSKLYSHYFNQKESNEKLANTIVSYHKLDDLPRLYYYFDMKHFHLWYACHFSKVFLISGNEHYIKNYCNNLDQTRYYFIKGCYKPAIKICDRELRKNFIDMDAQYFYITRLLCCFIYMNLYDRKHKNYLDVVYSKFGINKELFYYYNMNYYKIRHDYNMIAENAIKIREFNSLDKHNFIIETLETFKFIKDYDFCDFCAKFSILHGIDASQYLCKKNFDLVYEFAVSNGIEFKLLNPVDECIVCYKSTQLILDCNHYVCFNCQQEWIKQTCPICRKKYYL